MNSIKEVHGMIRIAGTNSIFPDDKISLDGFTADFNGTHKISKVIHEFLENSWHTIIEIGDDAMKKETQGKQRKMCENQYL